MDQHSIFERTVCSLVGLSRETYHYMPLPRDDEEPLRAEVIRMVSTYGRYGYRFIARMMRNSGWGKATTSMVARIWRQEGLKIPQKQPPRGRLWFNDGNCMRLRATHPNHVWSYDFAFIRDAYGGKIRMLTMIDEFTRKCLTIHCARRIGSIQAIEQLANAMIYYRRTLFGSGPKLTAVQSPIRDHLLSSSDCMVVHHGASYSRTEKVLEISA